jgi:hypothetical protein
VQSFGGGAALAGHARDLASEGQMLARLTRDLPGFMRRTMTLDEASERLRRRIQSRERSFLSLVKRAIYQHAASPYRQLLRHVGCEYGDLERLVRAEGIEDALRVLAERGVYVTFDELKGRRVAVRGSASFHFGDAAFGSPLVTPHWVVYTGGSGGESRSVMRSLQLVDDMTAAIAVTNEAHGLTRARHVFWVTNPLPPLLSYTLLGQPIVRWLHPVAPFPRKAWVVARVFGLSGRLAGHRIPMPRHLDLQDAHRLARWLRRRPRDGPTVVIGTMTSAAVRIAVAAREAGIDLTGVTFRLQSEPVTRARYEHLVATGARVFVSYSMAEMIDLALSCGTPRAPDDLHFATDRYALIGRRRAAMEGGPSVNAMLVTTLSDSAPKICLNTETGDYGSVQERPCGCLLGQLGLTTHVSDVRSYEKLSGEGVTFVRSNLLKILEEVLPARFGGTSIDYQLVEEEAPDSSTRLVLRVSPSVGATDEDELKRALLAELGSGGIVDRHHAELLRRAGSVEISRQPPFATGAGKVLPFQVLRSTSAKGP